MASKNNISTYQVYEVYEVYEILLVFPPYLVNVRASESLPMTGTASSSQIPCSPGHVLVNLNSFKPDCA